MMKILMVCYRGGCPRDPEEEEMPVLNASTPQIVRFRRDWIMGSVVMVNVNWEPPDRVVEPPATVLLPPDLDHAVCCQGK